LELTYRAKPNTDVASRKVADQGPGSIGRGYAGWTQKALG
jgi:hypothetical protein